MWHHAAMFAKLACGLALLLGCGTRSAAPEAPPARSASTTAPASPAAVQTGEASCKDRMAHLEQRLTALVKTAPGSMPALPPTARPAVAPHARAIDTPGLVLAVARDGQIVVPGSVLSAAEGPDLIDSREKRALEDAAMDRGPKPPWPLYIWADRDASVASVAALVKGVSKQWSVRLLVAGDPAGPPIDATLLSRPAVKRLADTRPRSEPDATRTVIEQLRAAVFPCADIIVAFARAAADGGVMTEAQATAVAVPRAAITCDCKMADIDVFEYAMLALHGVFHDPLKWIDMPELSPGDRRTIAGLVRS